MKSLLVVRLVIHIRVQNHAHLPDAAGGHGGANSADPSYSLIYSAILLLFLMCSYLFAVLPAGPPSP